MTDENDDIKATMLHFINKADEFGDEIALAKAQRTVLVRKYERLARQNPEIAQAIAKERGATEEPVETEEPKKGPGRPKKTDA
jgi:hypothetical protein